MANLERKKGSRHEYYLLNQEAIKARTNKYRLDNLDKVREYDRKRAEKQRANFLMNGTNSNYKRFNPFYKRWSTMKARCLNPKNQDYNLYGGRGIKVCDEWLKFDNFEKDMLPTFKKGLSLDRVDNNKGYSKENCRWATSEEQNNNKRNINLLEYNGYSMTLTQWAERLNLNRSTLSMRYYVYKWPVERILSTKTH